MWGHGRWTVHGRQGGGLDGGNCNRFLKKIDMLQKVVPSTVLPILDTLQLFKEVQTGCFGWDLCLDYKERIQAFKDSTRKLKVYFQEVLKLKSSTTPWKLYILCAHLEENLTRRGQGLGIVCEQAGEAVHHKVKKTKARYSIVNILLMFVYIMCVLAGSREMCIILSMEKLKRSLLSPGPHGMFTLSRSLLSSSTGTR